MKTEPVSSQDNMSSLKPSNDTFTGPEYCNIAEAQGKELKVALMNMIDIFKEEMNKSL